MLLLLRRLLPELKVLYTLQNMSFGKKEQLLVSKRRLCVLWYRMQDKCVWKRKAFRARIVKGAGYD